MAYRTHSLLSGSAQRVWSHSRHKREGNHTICKKTKLYCIISIFTYLFKVWKYVWNRTHNRIYVTSVVLICYLYLNGPFTSLIDILSLFTHSHDFFPLFMKNVLVALLHIMKWDPLCQKGKLYKSCPRDL